MWHSPLEAMFTRQDLEGLGSMGAGQKTQRAGISLHRLERREAQIMGSLSRDKSGMSLQERTIVPR